MVNGKRPTQLTITYLSYLSVGSHQEDFLDLTACVCGMSSLETALWAMFVEEEMFEGNNLYRCANCDRLVTAAKVSLNSVTPSHISHCKCQQRCKLQPFVNAYNMLSSGLCI